MQILGWTDGEVRVNNWAVFDGRLVYIDTPWGHILAPPEVDMDAAKQWVGDQLAHGDLVLDRGTTRQAMLAVASSQ
jgi:hypothetical protein